MKEAALLEWVAAAVVVVVLCLSRSPYIRAALLIFRSTLSRGRFNTRRRERGCIEGCVEVVLIYEVSLYPTGLEVGVCIVFFGADWSIYR